MARDDEQDAELAETRIVSDDEAAAAETVVVGDDAAGTAETRVASGAEAGTVAVPDRAAPAAPAEDADATQLVPRASSPAAESTPLVADRSVPETRVLDDKTAPPPVSADAPASSTPAPSMPSSTPPSTPPPTPIDPDRGLAPGTILFGEYEIVNVLGVGGMGEVYRARHRRLDEHRAIKVMHAELSKKKGASEFFYREAKALLAVRHPAVVHCHDLLSDDQGRVYLIMEMIEGVPLSKRISDGRLSPDDVALLGARVSHGLAAAHRKGVIHRDVSPDNIVLPNGRVQEAKIIDFGIAKLLEEGEGTIVDGFKGKLSYASPEQLGFHGGRIDGRSDFYSLGLVLVAAALGRPMPMGTTVVEAVDARRNFKKLPDAIPMGLASAIRPLLELDPDARPRYVDRLFVVSEGVEGAEVGPIPTGGIAPSGSTASSGPNRTGLFAALAVGLALLVGGGIFLSGGSDAPTVAPANDGMVDAAEGPTKVAPVVAPAPVEPTPAPAKPAPVVRKITAGDRLKIIGLSRNAETALRENRLMSPAGDNAFAHYQQILKLDPNNADAKSGMRNIASRYVAMADRAIDRGELEKAETLVDRARQADDTYAGIRAIEERLAR
ncbi:MAG: serine/threonine-protein kinase [Myxococcota bacterium]